MAAFPSSKMPRSSFAQYALLVSFAPCTACGATGLDWVGDARLESASQQHVNTAHTAAFPAPISASIPATAEQSEARPRLNHTVTLGEVEVAAAQSDVAPSGPQGPTVIVNNYNQVNVVTPAFGYANYGYPRANGRFSPGYVTPYRAAPSVPSPLPGQSWPAVADHGPSFPYHASPASPWTRTQ